MMQTIKKMLCHAMLPGALLTGLGLSGCAELAYDLAQDVAQTRCEKEPTPDARSACISRNSNNVRNYDSERERLQGRK
jgi:hypothetical protein